MTGGNFAIASTGEVAVCTNEGNADMGMSCQKINITAFGIDKIIPDLRSLGVFTRLLARSGCLALQAPGRVQFRVGEEAPKLSGDAPETQKVASVRGDGEVQDRVRQAVERAGLRPQ